MADSDELSARSKETLKKSRSAFKGQLTQFKNKLISLSTLGAIESNICRLRILYDKYHQVQLQLELQDDAASADRIAFEDDFELVESTLLDKLHELKKHEAQVKESVVFESPTNSTQIEQAIPAMSIKLPELKLPTFSGAENEWLAFRDIFLELIHRKTTIDTSIKFIYLKSHIRSGKAFGLIEHLPVTAANYETAWKTLCDRYDNAVQIQKAHMKEIYNVKLPIENSPHSLQAFIDHLVKNYNVLKSLYVPVETWDLMLIHHLTDKLDNSSKIHIIKNSEGNKLLNFEQFINLLRNRVRVLEAIRTTTMTPKQSNINKGFHQFKSKPTSLISNTCKCQYCGGTHSLPDCPQFSDDKITPQMRFQFVRNNQICTNCLMVKHKVGNCDQPSCRLCSLKHHSLHFGTTFRRSTMNMLTSASQRQGEPSYDLISQNNIAETPNYQAKDTSVCKLQNMPDSPSNNAKKLNQVLIGTALINISCDPNKMLLCRALLDSGSHLNFVTETLANLLNVKKHSCRKIISGIGGTESIIKSKTFLTISSRISKFSAVMEFFIIPRITNLLPSSAVSINFDLIPAEIELADPFFHVPNKIDVLLGAEIYNQLFTGKSLCVVKNLPPFASSVFGYVISGKILSHDISGEQSSTALCTNEILHNDMKRFWELETIAMKAHHSLEERFCEDHYSTHHKRLPSGRYSVSLPVNENIKLLGSTHYSSLKQFYGIERKLMRQPEIYRQYRDFMNEYLSLGHMTVVPNSSTIETSYKKAYYLPHHFVLKDSSTTTQLRVVFNGSSNSSSKLSLNDCLYKGPTVQQDLLSIILRFRKHLVAFTADIAKMYRQILIEENQQDLQRVWWRNNPQDKIDCFKLCTVTYGTKTAPYLATRTLQQLSLDECTSFPLASKTLMNDFYVDDVLTGAETTKDALKLKLDLVEMLQKGGFDLRKFSSNVPSISSSPESTSNITLVLGLSWNTSMDEFVMNFSKFSLDSMCTKRNILSEICQLFDPLGLCSPMILIAKLIMQTIWTLRNVEWDDLITNQVRDQWLDFKKQLVELEQITVPRCILVPHYKVIQLHGFSDASESGFGCVIYMRITDCYDRQHVRLICSKSRVAPLKKQTIPRLELCAALLLAQTMTKLLQSLDIRYDRIYLWSDSEITLLRIRSEPSKFASFVANRITQIQEESLVQSWCYVPSSQNPADLVSRGLMPKEFRETELWWSGPSFLVQSQSNWPKTSNHKIGSELLNLDLRSNTSLSVSDSDPIWDVFNRYSSYTKLVRIIAYIRRFINNIKKKHNSKTTGDITITELNDASNQLVKIVQQREFHSEIQHIKKHKVVQTSSRLKLLSPFLDELEILRVGGRLRHSSLNYNNKYPIVLPGSHVFSKLIVQAEHQRLLHCGPQTLLYNVRSQYWIIGGRNLCRQVVNQCILCFRNKPRLSHQIMGDLPADRITPSRPFSIVGIDFCGPFFTKPTTRSKIKIKLYICVFICFAVKATHFEVVMDLSAQSFLACLRRFTSRRGYPSKIYTDNATNFIGCRSELTELRNLFLSEIVQHEARAFCTSNKIEWLTIPPRSPHFGGLWEAAIKSAKWHMKRIIGLQLMTLEEYQTLICQIEACLNSRPLTAISNDPTDFTALSPGHFLIGEPLLAIPEPLMIDLNMNRLSRYQRLQVMFQNLWKRWHLEYLTELQKRYKWNKSSNEDYKIGSMVLMHEDNTPPINWPLGRIIETHPGQDGLIRVVSIKTQKSIFKRSIKKISILPLASGSSPNIASD